jgi:hypothetical protein
MEDPLGLAGRTVTIGEDAGSFTELDAKVEELVNVIRREIVAEAVEREKKRRDWDFVE